MRLGPSGASSSTARSALARPATGSASSVLSRAENSSASAIAAGSDPASTQASTARSAWAAASPNWFIAYRPAAAMPCSRARSAAVGSGAYRSASRANATASGWLSARAASWAAAAAYRPAARWSRAPIAWWTRREASASTARSAASTRVWAATPLGVRQRRLDDLPGDLVPEPQAAPGCPQDAAPLGRLQIAASSTMPGSQPRLDLGRHHREPAQGGPAGLGQGGDASQDRVADRRRHGQRRRRGSPR